MLRQLKYFQSAVRKNSFSEAAEENYISQSAISQQIQALERELGFQLLERKNRGFPQKRTERMDEFMCPRVLHCFGGNCSRDGTAEG